MIEFLLWLFGETGPGEETDGRMIDR